MVAEKDITQIIRVMKNDSDYDFTDYSEKSFARRIEKILLDNRISVADFLERLQKDSNFLEYTVREITVNTTELFRDVESWHAIKYRVLSKLKDNEEINIWHAGCSTGQEVYSMAIVLHELGLYERTKILATDLNIDVLHKAKEGKYQYRFNREYLENFDKALRYNPYNYEEVLHVPESKYIDIDSSTDTMTMKPFLRKNVEFKTHNLVHLAPPSDVAFDLILCRNVLIYFNYQLQNRIFDFFHSTIVKKGFLVLGKHESMLGPQANKFNKRGAFYIKKNLIK